MSARAKAKAGWGIWVIDTDSNWWVRAAGAAAATFRYESDIVCDGAPQPRNVRALPAFAAPAAPKFLPGPAAKVWPVWPNVFTGPKGSDGETEASGFSSVYPFARFVKWTSDMDARANVRPRPGGNAVAISKVNDPMTLRYSATRERRLRNLAVITIDVRLLPKPGPATVRSAVEIAGSFGSVLLRIDGGKAGASVRSKVGWRIFPRISLDRARVKQPKEISAKKLEADLKSGLRRIRLICTKDLGPGSGSATLHVNTRAEERGALQVG